MNTSVQITSAEPTIRIPAWRSASPKNLNTRRRSTSPITRAQNFAISPKLSIQPLGVATISFIRSSWDRGDLRMGGEQRLGERVVEREDAQERDDDRLVDSAPHPLGTARRGHALVTADHGDDRPEQGGLDHRAPQVRGLGVVEERGEERPERCVVDDRGEDAAEDA